jgi:signal transduction histidine kinase
LIGGLVAIVLLAALGIYQGRDAVAAVDEVERSHRTIEALDEVMARLGEAKSARRALGLTRDEAFRAVYRGAVTAIARRLDEIQRLSDSDEVQHHVDALRPLLDDRVARLEAQVKVTDTSGKEEQPSDAVSLGNTKLDDAIRREVTAMVDVEHDLLAVREGASHGRFVRAEVISAVGACVAVVMLLAAFGLLAREVRQRRRAEAETAAALETAESVNLELESFSYSVSHDLRAPLRAIDGFSQALLEDNGEHLDDEGKRHLARVRAASTRMGHLIDDLLALSRVTRAQLGESRVDLGELAKASFDELRDAAAGRTIELVIAPDLAATGDARLLRIVFDNLLGNAVKFTAKRDVAHIEVGATSDKGERVYFVRDDGVGFDPKYASKLFGAFQRLHDPNEFAGTGIGLATVQRIVRRHGGRVWATSEPGKGATFSFTLP